jgi:hypothetical protein
MDVYVDVFWDVSTSAVDQLGTLLGDQPMGSIDAPRAEQRPRAIRRRGL